MEKKKSDIVGPDHLESTIYKITGKSLSSHLELVISEDNHFFLLVTYQNNKQKID